MSEEYALVEFNPRKGEFEKISSIFHSEQAARDELEHLIVINQGKTFMVIDFPNDEALQSFIANKPKGKLETVMVNANPLLVHYGGSFNNEVFRRQD